jgi:peptide/nickel transport system permease protein
MRRAAAWRVGKALLTALLVAWVIATLVFLALRVIPGDPSTGLAAAGGAGGGEFEETRQRIEEELDLDKSAWTQYVTYLSGIVRLDLGHSFFGGADVLSLLRDSVPATIELTIAAMLIATVLGVVTGIAAAMRRDTWVDTSIRGVSTLGFSLPWFALGVISIVVFGVWLQWLPTLGRLPNSLSYDPITNFVVIDSLIQDRTDLYWPWIQHLILPATTLALTLAGFVTRMVRASVLDVLGDDHVRTARMKGLSERKVVQRHVLRNASLPIVTVLGLQFGSLLGGAVITEAVFSYPGVGSLLVQSINQRDYIVVQGAALAIALMFTLVTVIVDLLYLALDPRLRRT